ncbi:MAG: hypothetical protein IJP89_11345 [Synergistaceae bacterium]|nr:hypothetical protein [Synergistaceae bacterium]
MNSRFLFMTRTRDKDYRLFSDSGEAAGYDDEQFFSGLLKSSGVNGTENPFAVLTEHDSALYLIAGGMKTGSKDREGRPVRFTFCLEFPSHEQQNALNAFSLIASKWDEATALMSSCVDAESFRRGEISFDCVRFTEWLKGSGAGNFRVNMKMPERLSLSWPKIVAVFMAGILIASLCGMFYAGGIRNELEESRRREAESVAKVESVSEIYYGLKKTAGLMDEAYRYISMIEDSPENADIIAGNLRKSSREARATLDDVAGKISALGIPGGADK